MTKRAIAKYIRNKADVIQAPDSIFDVDACNGNHLEIMWTTRMSSMSDEIALAICSRCVCVPNVISGEICAGRGLTTTKIELHSRCIPSDKLSQRSREEVHAPESGVKYSEAFHEEKIGGASRCKS